MNIRLPRRVIRKSRFKQTQQSHHIDFEKYYVNNINTSGALGRQVYECTMKRIMLFRCNASGRASAGVIFYGSRIRHEQGPRPDSGIAPDAGSSST
jgi:hypothetical protein